MLLSWAVGREFRSTARYEVSIVCIVDGREAYWFEAANRLLGRPLRRQFRREIRCIWNQLDRCLRWRMC